MCTPIFIGYMCYSLDQKNDKINASTLLSLMLKSGTFHFLRTDCLQTLDRIYNSLLQTSELNT